MIWLCGLPLCFKPNAVLGHLLSFVRCPLWSFPNFWGRKNIRVFALTRVWGGHSSRDRSDSCSRSETVQPRCFPTQGVKWNRLDPWNFEKEEEIQSEFFFSSTKEGKWDQTVFGVKQWRAAQAISPTNQVFCETRGSPWKRPCFISPLFLRIDLPSPRPHVLYWTKYGTVPSCSPSTPRVFCPRKERICHRTAKTTSSSDFKSPNPLPLICQPSPQNGPIQQALSPAHRYWDFNFVPPLGWRHFWMAP